MKRKNQSAAEESTSSPSESNTMGKRGFNLFKGRAKEYINDKDKSEQLLNDAREKARRKRGPLTEVWDKIQLMFSLFEDWLKGNYKEIPIGSIIMIIVTLIYFVIPTDLIPDFIVGVGYIDDAAVLAFAFNQIRGDLDNYKNWKSEKE